MGTGGKWGQPPLHPKTGALIEQLNRHLSRLILRVSATINKMSKDRIFSIAALTLLCLGLGAMWFLQEKEARGIAFWVAIIGSAVCLAISSFIRSKQQGNSGTKSTARSALSFLMPLIIIILLSFLLIIVIFSGADWGG